MYVIYCNSNAKNIPCNIVCIICTFVIENAIDYNYDTMDNNVLPISLMNQLLIYGASYVIPEFHAEISYFSPCSWFLF